MSNIKYDDVACENVASNLENINSLLTSVKSELSRLVEAIPDSTMIDDKIIRLSTKTRVNEDNTIEEYIDYDTVRYYETNCKAPLLSAKSNIARTSTNLGGINKTVGTIDDKVRAIQKLVDDYEQTTVEQKEIDILKGGPDKYEGGSKEVTYVEEEDGEGTTNLNVDTDGDGKPDLNIDVNGDGKADLNIDVDSDGKPDINIDVNGDGKADLNVDVDSDGKPDLNIDVSGNGLADLNIDTDNNGKPDLNIDLDGNGKADLNIDVDNDGKPDLNVDVNGDGAADLNIDTDSDGKPDVNIDADGDGKVDPILPEENPMVPTDPTVVKPVEKLPDDSDSGVPPKTEVEDDGDKGKSDLFDGGEADDSSDGFADNIVSGVTPGGTESETGDGTGTNGNNSGNNDTGVDNSGGRGGVLGANTSGTGTGKGEGESGLFPFLPGSSTSSDGENPDFIYRGLYDQSGNENFDMSQIKYNAIGEGGAGVAKGAAVAGAVGLGVSGADAVATINENRKMEGDVVTSSEEKEEKKLVKTVISSSILGIVSIGYIIAALMPNTSILAIILLGVAMAVSAITATSGLKIGKYIGFGATLFVSLLTFVLASCGVISPIGYIVVFATFVILSIAAFLLDLLKGMFDDKVELVPIIIAIAVGLFFGMLKVLDIIGWIVFLVLLVLTVGAYFLWDKVIKDKLPDDDDDEEVYDNVIYKPASYTENSPMNTPEQEKFDPRSLYKEEENTNKVVMDNTANQNPFANYNPQNSSFDNAFKDDDNKDNNPFNGMF